MASTTRRFLVLCTFKSVIYHASHFGQHRSTCPGRVKASKHSFFYNGLCSVHITQLYSMCQYSALEFDQ